MDGVLVEELAHSLAQVSLAELLVAMWDQAC